MDERIFIITYRSLAKTQIKGKRIDYGSNGVKILGKNDTLIAFIPYDTLLSVIEKEVIVEE